MKNVSSWLLFIQYSEKFQVVIFFSVWNEERICLKCPPPPPLPPPDISFSVPPNYTFFIYKQPVKQLGLELQKVKQLLGLKHVTISNFANKIFAHENIVTIYIT